MDVSTINVANQKVDGMQDAEAIRIIKDEVRRWEEGSVWVTNNIAFQMRNIIDKARQNYFGIYSEKYNRTNTSRNIWDPITEIMVDTVVYNIDLDPKDIVLKAKNPDSIGSANVTKMAVRDTLHKVGFGEILDDIERFGCIDGTAVLKTFKGINPRTGKVELRSYWVDLRNFYIDPNSTNIQDSPAVIERAVMTKEEVLEYAKLGWENVEDVFATPRVPVYNNLIAESRGETPLVEIWERWGLAPKSILTGDADDTEFIDLHLIVSNINSHPIVHVARENPDPKKYKPYEEWHFKKLANRWYGRGIGEMLFSHQLYANIVANMRKNVNLVKGNGLYKIRKGSGIKQSDLQGLVEGGGIQVTNLNTDIEPFADRNFAYDQSMAESDRLMAQARMMTGATEASQGEALPSTTSATTATIQNLNLQTRFEFMRESLGRFVQRVIERHYLPIIREMLSQEELVRITGDSSFLKDFDERVINKRINSAILEYVMTNGSAPDPMMVEEQRNMLMQNMESLGDSRYIKGMKDVMDADYDVEVHVTNEEKDFVSTMQNLRDTMITLPQLTTGIDMDALIQDWLDMIGLDGRRYFKKQTPMNQMNPMSPQMSPQTNQVTGEASAPTAPTFGPPAAQTPTDVMAQSMRAVAQGKTA